MAHAEGQCEVTGKSSGHLHDMPTSDEKGRRPSGGALTMAQRACAPQAQQPRFASARTSQVQPFAVCAGRVAADHLQDTTLKRGDGCDHAAEPWDREAHRREVQQTPGRLVGSVNKLRQRRPPRVARTGRVAAQQEDDTAANASQLHTCERIDGCRTESEGADVGDATRPAAGLEDTMRELDSAVNEGMGIDRDNEQTTIGSMHVEPTKPDQAGTD